MSDEDSEPLTHLETCMAYYGGDLSGAELAAFETHLADCAECQAALARARQVFPSVMRALAPGFEPEHSIEEQMARFQAEVVLPARPARPWRRTLVRLAAAAAVLLLVLLGERWLTRADSHGGLVAAPVDGGTQQP